MTTRPDTMWTSEAVEHLKRMHAENLTFSEIAVRLKAMNYDFTRNACIGKSQRLALPQRLTASDVAVIRARNRSADEIEAAKERRRIRHRIPSPRKRKRRGSVKQTVPTPSPPLVPKAESYRRNVILVDLEHGACKWPVNDGGPFLFCGCPQHPGRPYCTDHVRDAYQPVGRR